MSATPFCQCAGTVDEKKLNWRIVHYRCNYSAFNGWKKTASAYSAVECKACHRIWRTKASYVESLRF